ncbi:keratin, type II cytoskeletal 8-like [Thalassophryne amazonica]|uniref:keratin, type II cytoskeletal 8-like n=1 Tax=Thalassophryne amazonica TaxID=390379 RepID=UPI001471E0FA|nr:keratin, type II cytoskeletal 8-like [Thalassophryne amazonica]
MKLHILREQDGYEGKVEDIVRQLENELQWQVEGLTRERAKLEVGVLKSQEELQETKMRYEDELLKKADLENEFVLTKRDVDEGHMVTTELALELEDLIAKLEFLQIGCEEEIKELELQAANKTVIIRDNKRRSLEMDETVDGVCVHYGNMDSSTRKDIEHWNQKEMDTLILTAGKLEQEVRELKKEITDTLHLMKRLNVELENLTVKEESLRRDISEAATDGNIRMDKAREDIMQLKGALRQANRGMHQQTYQYQELLNRKMTLDIELTIYRKLLEGEERRMNNLMHRTDIYPPSKQQTPKKPKGLEPLVASATDPASKKHLLIQVEVEARRVHCKSSKYTED